MSVSSACVFLTSVRLYVYVLVIALASSDYYLPRAKHLQLTVIEIFLLYMSGVFTFHCSLLVLHLYMVFRLQEQQVGHGTRFCMDGSGVHAGNFSDL